MEFIARYLLLLNYRSLEVTCYFRARGKAGDEAGDGEKERYEYSRGNRENRELSMTAFGISQGSSSVNQYVWVVVSIE